MKHPVNIVCALECEARPLIRHYKMKAAGGGRFRVYRNDALRLVITGVGKEAAAAGTRFLRELAGEDGPALWLNVGIAGHPRRPTGQVLLAHKIQDSFGGRSWYPHLAFDPPVPTETLITVGEPAGLEGENALYDMEAAGFYPAALENSSTELVHCLKVVSDNTRDKAETIRPARVRAWMEAAVPMIDETMGRLRKLADAHLPPSDESGEINTILGRWHFTAYQEAEARKLWRRVTAREGAAESLRDLDLSRFQDAGRFLSHLRSRLHSAPLRIGAGPGSRP